MLTTTTTTTTLFQYPTVIYIIRKNRYKYGESMPPPPGLTRRANAPQLPGGGGLGTGGID